jgi:hypothetical protein
MATLGIILIGWTIALIMVIGFVMVAAGYIWMPIATAIA